MILDVLDKMGYVIRECCTFIVNVLIEVWHYIQVLIKGLLISLIISCIISFFILKPTYEEYNNIVCDYVDNSDTETFKGVMLSNEIGPVNEYTSEEDVNYIEYNKIPNVIKESMIFIQDPTFKANDGIDYERLKEALILLKNSNGNHITDTNTIASELMDKAFLQDTFGVDKWIEKFLGARALTKKYKKNELMEYYCNIADFANGVVGIQNASNFYFGENIDDLSLKQQVYLCAITINVDEYDPYVKSSTIASEANTILKQLKKKGIITNKECNTAINESVYVLN